MNAEAGHSDGEVLRTELVPFQPRSWRNRGRMSEGHRERLAERSAQLGFPDAAAAAAWAPQVLDVGFGSGESLLSAARAWPSARVLGVEVHAPGLLRATDGLVDAGLDGGAVRVLAADVTVLLPLLRPGSLRLVQAFHPDPWPKRRHAARRLFSADVLARLTELLAPGGVLHLVTDDDTYAAAVRADVPPVLTPCIPPAAPRTRYGQRARIAGRTVHDLAWMSAG